MARMAGQVFTDKSELLANSAKSSFEVNSELQGKLGADLGNTAGVMLDLERNKLLRVNDGNPTFIIKDGNRMQIAHDNDAAYPFPGKGDRYQEKVSIPAGMAGQANEMLYNFPNQRDTLSSRGPRGVETELEYGSAMRYGYTPGLVQKAPTAPSRRQSAPAPQRRPSGPADARPGYFVGQ